MEKVAIIINTRNRPREFDKCKTEIARNSVGLFLAYDTRLIVVDDASSTVYCNANFRFETRAGIPRAKNKGLRLAYDWGAGHFFLFDDDCYPKSGEWWKAYMGAGQNHLAFTFTTGWDGTRGWAKGVYVKELGVVRNVLSCGCMMYVRRKVLDTVGGMDESFGVLSKYCDTEWQRRIHNAGLTPYPFIDVKDSEELLYSMDEHGEVERSFTAEERVRGLSENRALFERVKEKARYCEF